MGGGSGQSQTQTSEPWAGAQPYLTDVMRNAQQQFRQGGPQYYGGSTVTPFSAQQEQGLALQQQRALEGAPHEQAFGGYLTGSLGQGQADLASSFGAAQNLQQGGAAGQQSLIGQLNGGPGIGAASAFANAGPGYAQQALQQSTDPTAAGQLNPFTAGGPDFNTRAQQAQQALGGAGSDQLNATASGAFLNANPYLDQQFEHAAGKVKEQFSDITNPAIAATFGSAGRTGSGLHQATLTDAAGQVGDSLSGLANDIYGQNYQQERGRQLQAGAQLGQLGLGAANIGEGLYQGDQSRALGAAGQLTDENLALQGLSQQGALGALSNSLQGQGLAADIYNQGQNRNLQAGLGLQGAGLDAIGAGTDIYGAISQDQARAGALAPSLSGLQYNNINQLLGVGDAVQGQAANYLQDDINRFNYQQNAPYAALDRYNSLVQGFGGLGGTTTATGPSGNRFAGALGGAATGASLGSVVPGLGTALGAGIGGLGGLLFGG